MIGNRTIIRGVQAPNPAYNPNPYLEMDILTGLKKHGITSIRKDNTVSGFVVNTETASIAAMHGKDADGFGTIDCEVRSLTSAMSKNGGTHGETYGVL